MAPGAPQAMVFIYRLRVSEFIKCANVLITPLMSQCPVSRYLLVTHCQSGSANQKPAQTQVTNQRPAEGKHETWHLTQARQENACLTGPEISPLRFSKHFAFAEILMQIMLFRCCSPTCQQTKNTYWKFRRWHQAFIRKTSSIPGKYQRWEKILWNERKSFW